MTTALRPAAPPRIPAPPPSRRRAILRRKALPYLLLAPALVTFGVFKAYPIVSSLLLSLTTGSGANTRNAGLANYRKLLDDPLFWTALGNTARILVVQVPLMLALALGLSVALHAALVRFRTVWRLGIFMPSVTGLVATGVVFAFLLDTDRGAVNSLLEAIGLSGVDWLGDGFWARMAVVLVLTWHYTGYNAVIYLAGLQGIPKELYEAAMVDGAARCAGSSRSPCRRCAPSCCSPWCCPPSAPSNCSTSRTSSPAAAPTTPPSPSRCTCTTTASGTSTSATPPPSPTRSP